MPILANPNQAQRATIRAELWSATTGGQPDSNVTNLTVPSNVAAGNVAFAAPAGTVLSSNTTYVLVLYTTGNFSLAIRATNSDSEDSGGQTGWSIADNSYYKSQNSPVGGSWTSVPPSMKIRVNGSAETQSSDNTLSVDTSHPTPACGTAVTDLTVRPVMRLRLAPPPTAATDTQVRILASHGPVEGWRTSLPIRKFDHHPTYGHSRFIRSITFAELRNNFPGFRGFENRLKDTPAITARCTWQFDGDDRSTGSGGTAGGLGTVHRSTPVVTPAEPGGFALALKADAFWVRTESGRVAESEFGSFMGARGESSRVRAVLDGSRTFALAGGPTLAPSLELGLRHDGGDAETGTGLEFGAGLGYANPSRGLDMSLRLHGLAVHAEDGYDEWGVSGQLTLVPGEAGRGLSASLTPSWGVDPGGSGQLWAQPALTGLAANGDTDPSSRLDGELGYGMAMFGGRYTGTPNAGFGLSEAAREYRMGWRLTRRRTIPGSSSASMRRATSPRTTTVPSTA